MPKSLFFDHALNIENLPVGEVPHAAPAGEGKAGEDNFPTTLLMWKICQKTNILKNCFFDFEEGRVASFSSVPGHVLIEINSVEMTAEDKQKYDRVDVINGGLGCWSPRSGSR